MKFPNISCTDNEAMKGVVNMAPFRCDEYPTASVWMEEGHKLTQ